MFRTKGMAMALVLTRYAYFSSLAIACLWFVLFSTTEATHAPQWLFKELKLAAAIIVLNLLFGAFARRLWNPGADGWLDFAWYAGLCQGVAALALVMACVPLFMIANELLGLLTPVALIGGAAAGHQFLLLERRRREGLARDQIARLAEAPDTETHAPHAIVTRATPSYGKMIAGVALGLLLSVTPVVLTALTLQTLIAPDGDPTAAGASYRKLCGGILAICAACGLVASFLIKPIGALKGAMIGLGVGCFFWSVLFFAAPP